VQLSPDQGYWPFEIDIPALTSVLRMIAPASVAWLAAALVLVVVGAAVLDVATAVLLVDASSPEDSAE